MDELPSPGKLHCSCTITDQNQIISIYNSLSRYAEAEPLQYGIEPLSCSYWKRIGLCIPQYINLSYSLVLPSMTVENISLACNLTDRTRAIYEGQVRPTGVDLNFLPYSVEEVF